MLQDNENSGLVAYYLLGSIPLLLLVVAIVTYAFLHQKKVIRLKTRLHEEEIRKQQAVFDALQEGEEKERTRLAEELHDGIGAKLSGLKMNLDYLKTNTRENQALIGRVYEGISETLEEVREISHNLLPLRYNERNLEQLLLDYLERFRSADRCRYTVFVNVEQEIDANLKKVCCRLITELLNNIHKHANATMASVQINADEGKMEITVEDNGTGFDPESAEKKGIGLHNLRHGVALFNGSLDIDSSVNGTCVIIELPLNSAT